MLYSNAATAAEGGVSAAASRAADMARTGARRTLGSLSFRDAVAVASSLHAGRRSRWPFPDPPPVPTRRFPPASQPFDRLQHTLVRDLFSRRQPGPRKRMPTACPAGADSSANSGRPRATVVSLGDQDLGSDRDGVIISLSIDGRQFNLNRSKGEEVGKCLARIKQNALKASGRKPDKRSRAKNGCHGSSAPPMDGSASSDLCVMLFDNEAAQGPPIPDNTPNDAAWEKSRVLRIGETLWDIFHNVPMVDQLSITSRPVVGLPVVPSIKLLFADEDAARWRWWRGKPGKGHKRNSEPLDASGCDWELLEGSAGMLYTPTKEDKGCLLRVDCLPAKLGELPDRTDIGSWSSAVSGVVEDGPPLWPGANRHPLTPSPLAGPRFRVATYNCLADQYVRYDRKLADKPHLRQDLFRFCPYEYLDLEYRKQLIAGELMGFHPDIICMQEVDTKAFNSFYEPYFRLLGFEGIMTKKGGLVDEGCALFVRRSRFKIAARKDILMKDIFRPPLKGDVAVFAPLLEASPKLARALQNVGTVGQLAIVSTVDNDDEAGPLCIANTHMFYHPDGGNIRTLHTAVVVQEAKALATAWAESDGGTGGAPAVVFCGDLNSDLNDDEGVCGAIQMLAEGRLSASHWEWAARANFDWDANDRGASVVGEGVHGAARNVDEAARGGDEVSAVTGVEVVLPCRLMSADGLASDFTNFVPSFQALLDYIWLQPDSLRVERFIPLPPREEVEGFCPSARWPSDHVSVVADLCWVRGAGQGSESDCSAASAAAITSRPEYILPAQVSNATKGVAPLLQQGLLAVPTDTLYGLACCANSPAAIDRMRQLKGHPNLAHIPICLGSHEHVQLYGDTTCLPPGLLQDLLPGPTTIVLKRLKDAPLSAALNPGASTIGIRVPDSSFVQGLCRRLGRAIALTSAVRGGNPIVEIADFKDMWKQCEVVFDGGPSPVPPLGSTVIDLSVAGRFSLLRRGVDHEHYVGILSSRWGLTFYQ